MTCSTCRQKNDGEDCGMDGPLFSYAEDMTGPIIYVFYYLSVAKGLDVDKPRNLAKSVTVE